MQAQVRNDAAGWDAVENGLEAESEPVDPAAVWGNYTHEELAPWGYGMVVTVGMSNDYWGYIATYREFQRGDHYRKALTGLGPHASDFLATRLSRMAACLNGWPGPAPAAGALDAGTGPCGLLTPKDTAYALERDRQQGAARLIGEAATRYVPLYAATLPADGGTPEVISQPAGIRRFDAARVAWVGGSNWFDLPDVRVERQTEDGWAPAGDLDLEVQLRTHFPTPADMPAWRTGSFAWRWEATFEAFASDVALPDPTGVRHTATPPGTYRFVIDGRRHTGLGATEPYHLESQPFTVAPWDGLVVRDLRVGDGEASFVVDPIDYPDTYVSPFPFIHGRDAADTITYPDGSVERFCFHCSFEPWIDVGMVASARVTVERGGTLTTVPAALGTDGRWHATGLEPGDAVSVQPGDVVDRFGQTTAVGSASPS
jgi:hypothetical protein